MAQNGRVLLKNWNKTKTEVFASDGQSISLMPETKTSVEEKYNWNLPKGVEVYRENFTVFGKKKTKEVDITKDSGNLKNASDNRTVLNTTDDKKTS